MSLMPAFFSETAPVAGGGVATPEEVPFFRFGGGTPFFKAGEFTATHAGLIHAAVIIGVVVFLPESLLLKRTLRVCRRAHRRHANLLTSAQRSLAVSHSTHLLLFAFTIRWFAPVPATTGPLPLSVNGISFGNWEGVMDHIASLLLILAFTVALLHLVRVPVAWFRRLAHRADAKLDDMLIPVLDTAIRVVVILGGLIRAVSSLSGSTPAQILATLAVGGLAVGLAAQDTVKNFFGTLMLILDKPFMMGDYVNIGSHEGTVEGLGLRSTRIRTLSGDVVSVPNGDLANRAIQNVSQRRNIRQALTLGLSCDMSASRIEEALAIIRNLLKNHEGMESAFPPRVYFEKIDSASLNIKVISWYHPADSWKCFDFNQRLQLDILRRFAAAGITRRASSRRMAVVRVPLPNAGEMRRRVFVSGAPV